MRRSLLAAAFVAAAAMLVGCSGSSQSGFDDGTGGPGNLAITSNPTGAAIAIDGQDTGRRTPASLSVAAEPGLGTEYLVTLSLPGYNQWSGLATVASGDTFTLRADLVSESAGRGILSAQSEPSGARVFVNGLDTGRTTPATIENVPAGRHVVELRRGGYHRYREEVVVLAGVTAVSAPVLTQIGYGRVTGLVVDPEGNGLVDAQVSVRGETAQTRTTAQGVFVLPNVPAGTHTLNAAITIAGGGPTLQGTRDGVVVVDGKTTSNMDILTSVAGAAGRIVGRVLDYRRSPVEGAEVFASQAVAPDFLPNPNLFPRRATTDVEGHYTLEALPTGFWVVTAAYPGLATVTRGIESQIYVTAGGQAEANFELPRATAGRPGAPLQLSAVAFTLPTAASRATRSYEAICDGLLRETLVRRWGAWRGSLDRVARLRVSRSASPGSLIEVDLAWIAPTEPDVIGYFIGRSNQADTGFALIEDLLNPHAGLWIDYDQRVSPGRPFYYRVTAVNSQGDHSDPSRVAEARPLDRLVSTDPAEGATVTAPPTFRWEPLPGAFVHEVQVFDAPPQRYTAVPFWKSAPLYGQTSVQYTGSTPMQPGHTYYWIVAAGNSSSVESINGWSVSRIGSFTIR